MGMPDVLRLATADVGEVLTIQRAAYVTEAQLHDDVRLPPLTQTLEELAAELADPAVITLGVRENARLVAAGRVRVGPDGAAVVSRLAVTPDRQGRGLGTAMLRAAEAVVPSSVREMRLFTGERSVANLRLYARHGYRETHRRRAGWYDVVHLAKPLARE